VHGRLALIGTGVNSKPVECKAVRTSPHDPTEHATTGGEDPGGLRNEKVRGSNPLSSTT
jgi:hypothetical protein